MSRPIQAYIDLSALQSNLQLARRLSPSRIMAVLKANAYGHGLLRVAQALSEADGLAMLDIYDAMAIREAGSRQTLLLLEGFFTAEELPLIAEYELASVIHSAQQLAMLDAYPRRNSLKLWLKINTGMNRLGFTPEQVPAVMEKLKSHPAVLNITMMTHFSHADEPKGVADQVERFNELSAPYDTPCSLANSAALLRYPSSHRDWVRPGIMLYGASPFVGTSAEQIGLRPVMTLTSELISVRELKTGDDIGYAGLFRADKPMRLGIVACGYADGYARQAPTGTPILVNGQLTRTLGRVSMDMLNVDLSGLKDADVGSQVTLWGKGLPVEQVAHSAGTVSYELLCALTERVPINY